MISSYLISHFSFLNSSYEFRKESNSLVSIFFYCKLNIISGRQVIAVARTADLVLMMLDATKKDVHRDLLEKELESVGIRLNKAKPNIYFKVITFSNSLNLLIINNRYNYSLISDVINN